MSHARELSIGVYAVGAKAEELKNLFASCIMKVAAGIAVGWESELVGLLDIEEYFPSYPEEKRGELRTTIAAGHDDNYGYFSHVGEWAAAMAPFMEDGIIELYEDEDPGCGYAIAGGELYDIDYRQVYGHKIVYEYDAHGHYERILDLRKLKSALTGKLIKE